MENVLMAPRKTLLEQKILRRNHPQELHSQGVLREAGSAKRICL